ncbi:hypothetical protein POX_b02668 [Penicillium oxalicum]|uniref:hypothetical protein n=1 Tax=Penicillium oxalicum TaxID=69781 RepID=UPI0020B80B3E|nr:hypothetical protein POX_b02668 [Penicillium oxalicum]KAI2792628.1 hypothetical protein POX_b02668 [Penicillium oxalicum]
MEKPDHRSVRSRSASVSSQGELEQWCEQNGGFSDILDPEDEHATLFASLGIPTRKELEVQWHAQMFGTTASQQASANTSSSQSARETRLNPVTTSETFVELPSNKRRKHAPQISANNRTPTGLTADRNQTQTEKACNRCRVKRLACDSASDGCIECKKANVECLITDRMTGKTLIRRAAG